MSGSKPALNVRNEGIRRITILYRLYYTFWGQANINDEADMVVVWMMAARSAYNTTVKMLGVSSSRSWITLPSNDIHVRLKMLKG